MAGIVSSVGTSQMELTVPEHVIFTVRIGPSTQVTEDGQPASLSRIRAASAVRVHGAFDMQAHTIEAEVIEFLSPQALRLLEFRSANFLKTWTSGIVTAVQPALSYGAWMERSRRFRSMPTLPTTITVNL